MCLSPKYTIHPYLPLALINAKEFVVLGSIVDKDEFKHSIAIDSINEKLTVEFGEVNQVSINYLCDSSYVVDSCGRRHNAFIQLKCHNCKECRYEYQHDVVNRAILEASVSYQAYFYTLTYDNDHVPHNGLQKSDVSAAINRLRTHCRRYIRPDFEFVNLYVGEYGCDLRYSLRPHYHGIIFMKTPLSPLEEIDFFRMFCPESNPECFYNSLNKRLESERGNRFIKVEHFWPFGEIFDIDKPKKHISVLARYVSKYITKQLIEEDEEHIIARESVRYPLKSQFSDGVIRECHLNKPFVQLPKRIGLGVSALDNYKDFILRSNRSDIRVKCHGQLIRMAVPHIFYKKLFPTISQLKPNIIFNVKLFSGLLEAYRLKLREHQFVNVNTKIQFDEFLNISDDYVTRFRRISRLHMNRRLTRQLETELYIANFRLSVYQIQDWMKAIIDEFLFDCPDDEEFDKLYSSKLDFLNKLPPPALDWSQRSIYKEKKSRNSFYQSKCIAYGYYDSVR